ncbi:MAG: response regulator [Burkholderiaceae bacterium]|nr:response regulator [Burkholderiaceae bacterium]
MLKVVTIDGSAISRGLLNTVLTDGGHEVVGDSNTSPAGLARMIKLQPQLVCVDIGLEDDRMAILDTLREGLPRAILFLVSGKIEPSTVEQALQHGVHGFIVKPFNSVTVLKTIRHAVIQVVKKQQARVAAQTPTEQDDQQ